LINSNNDLSIDFLTQHGEMQKLSIPKENCKATNDLINNLTCCVCMILYEKTLKIRKCEHIVCANCYLRLANSHCPVCRIDFPLDGNGIFELPSRNENSFLGTIKESYKVTSRESSEQTKQQATKQNNYYSKSIRQTNPQVATREKHITVSRPYLLPQQSFFSHRNNTRSSGFDIDDAEWQELFAEVQAREIEESRLLR
jgi:hypothetical protein